MTDHVDRYQAEQWIALTTAFPARFTGRCVHCRRAIAVGQFMVGVFSRHVDKAWMHGQCARRLAIPGFTGKR